MTAAPAILTDAPDDLRQDAFQRRTGLPKGRPLAAVAPYLFPVLDLGRGDASPAFYDRVGSGVPARVEGEHHRRPARTWRGGRQACRPAFFIHICARAPVGAAGAARFPSVFSLARHRTLIGGAA